MNKKPLLYILASLMMTILSINPLYAENQPTISGETAVVYDPDSTYILYDKNANQKMYPASITKLMTALLASQNLSPTDTITYSETAINSISSNTSRIGLLVDETISVEDSLYGLLLMSANETANGLAEKTSGSIDEFVHDMNQKAIELGSKNTHFVNPHGLYDPDHYTTAFDMALITAEVIKDPYLLKIMSQSMHQIQATNKMEDIRYLAQQHKMLNKKNDQTIYRPDIIAGKVGFTSESGHTLVTVLQKEGKTLIAVILKDDGRLIYEDTASILDYAFNNYQSLLAQAKKEEEAKNLTSETELLNQGERQESLQVTQTSKVNLVETESEETSDQAQTNDKKSNYLLIIFVTFLALLILLFTSSRIYQYKMKSNFHSKYKSLK